MADTTLRDRAAGAIMGAFIGDALGLGPHWYYDLAELRRDYGEWISGYTDPRPGRYHAGLKAGQSSQAGFILELTLRSLVACGQYDEAGTGFSDQLDERCHSWIHYLRGDFQDATSLPPCGQKVRQTARNCRPAPR